MNHANGLTFASVLLKVLVWCGPVTALLSGPAHSQDAHAGSPGSVIIRHFTIYGGGEYCAWPSLTKTAEGDLIVVFTRTEEHLAPDGAIMLSRSTDGGATWLPPVVVTDSPIDDRESGLTTLKNGWILGHFWSTLHTRTFYEALPPEAYRPEVIHRWIRFVERPEYRGARGMHGAWSAISRDGGRTWSRFLRGHDSVHGGIELGDGSLLLASYRESRDGVGIFRAASVDSSWQLIATIRSTNPDSIGFGEPHVLQLPTGRILVMIRATTHPYDDQDPRCVLWESYSDDGGKSWTVPFSTPLWGFPPHMTLLADGRVLCTYGYRRPPYGQRACISRDGITWNLRDEVVLRDDAPNHDLGYPASLEIKRGIILTVYYQPDVPRGTVQEMSPPDPQRTKPGILGTLWRLPDP
jgi:hypothetical protein